MAERVHAGQQLSVGTYRHLSQCSDQRGTFMVLAIDHRGSLVSELQKHQSEPVSYDEVVAFKLSVMRHLAGGATAVLTDPDYGLPGLLSGVIPGHVGLLAPLEVTDYGVHPNKQMTTLIPGWDVAKLKRTGFSGAKLLLYYHPEAPNARSQTELLDQTVEQCKEQQMPLFLEPISYSLDSARPLSSSERRQVVIDTAHHFSRRGVDVLKMEFPVDVRQDGDEGVWMEALRELDSVCSVPWTLLSAGVAYDVFLRQATLACIAGASGVMAGRAIWAEAVALQGEAREQFLATTGYERVRRLAAVCQGLGKSWKERHTAPVIGEQWYH